MQASLHELKFLIQKQTILPGKPISRTPGQSAIIVFLTQHSASNSIEFANAVKIGDKQVAQITFNDDIIQIIAAMLEEKTEFVQTYFANQDFQNFVNVRVYQAGAQRLLAVQ